MINFKEKIAGLLEPHAAGLTEETLAAMIEIPQESRMGDYAFPCFRLAKTMKKAPPLIAQEIAQKLESAGLFDKVEAVNAYVNLFLSRRALLQAAITAVV
ncbi:MAG: arginine--tRNA ligase, partial [Clostridiales Family XIII bacterium]|nr:arginine--tRNA ligase [Clostridiales Family XIII bacterium]